MPKRTDNNKVIDSINQVPETALPRELRQRCLDATAADYKNIGTVTLNTTSNPEAEEFIDDYESSKNCFNLFVKKAREETDGEWDAYRKEGEEQLKKKYENGTPVSAKQLQAEVNAKKSKIIKAITGFFDWVISAICDGFKIAYKVINWFYQLLMNFSSDENQSGKHASSQLRMISGLS